MSHEANRVPKTYSNFMARFPNLGEAHHHLGVEIDRCGPLESQTQELIKLGICIGAGLESAVKSHVRRSLEAGVTPEELEHAIVLGMSSIGFPRTVAAWKWAQEAIDARS